MVGKVCVVTGATSGIGYATALALARMGATVVMLGGRSPERAAAAREALIAQTANPAIEWIPADFASLASTRQAAAALRARHTALDVLVNNAGLFAGRRQLSADGIELTFAVNHLAPFLLTLLLLDPLLAAPAARVVNVASTAHQGGSPRFDDIRADRSYNGWRAYADSKLANVLFTYALARRLAGTQVTANCLHPGGVATNFPADNGGLIKLLFTILDPFLLTPEQGAQTSIYLASSPDVAGVTGKYFVKCRARASGRVAYDQGAQERLWALSESLVGPVHPPAIGA